MRTRNILLACVAASCLCPAAWGQQTLSSAEVRDILQQVTSQPRQTWLPAGAIEAIHQEYSAPRETDQTKIRNEIDKAVREYQNNPNKLEKTPERQKMKEDAIRFNVRYRLSNESHMRSRVTAKYDNGRFYWEINVDSRSDTVKPDASLAGNYMTRQFDLASNQRRIAAWDGQEYTAYSDSGGQAVVDAAVKLPRAVTGPLTAGLIPWGNGRYSYASLMAAQISARRNAGGTISMTVTPGDGTSMDLTLDPAKAYAVIEAKFTHAGGQTATYTCSGYKQFGGNWVPSTINIERQNSDGDRLPTSEQWTFTSISAAAPGPGSFDVPIKANDVVEYFSPLAASSAIYIQSDAVDTRGLLAQRLAYAAGRNSQRQNCATAALRQVASELGKSVPESALARLVGADGGTSMYDMKRFAESLGLYCRAVKPDLATLRGLNGVKAILHIPGQNHFVVLSEVNDRDIRLVDLSNRQFYYRQSLDFLPTEWPEGVALLLSDQPIPSQSAELPDSVLATFTGDAGWACNEFVQEEFVGYCDGFITGCDGAVTVYYERWGCGSAPSGSCYNRQMIASQDSPCIWDPYYDCSITGEWYYYYMGACQ